MFRSLSIIITIIAVIGVNILSTFVFTRFDFTQGQIYTLSSSTKSIVRDLEETIHLKIFISNNLPPQAEVIKQQFTDYINEYVALSHGKLVLSYVDPAEKPEAVQFTQMIGIPELQLQVIEKDKRQVLRAYMGMAILKEKAEKTEVDTEFSITTYEKFETIPIIENMKSFEYDLTSAIKKVSSMEEKVIAFMGGHGEHMVGRAQQQQGMMAGLDAGADYKYMELLQKTYDVTSIELDPENTTIEGVDTLIIAGPRMAFEDYEITAIQDFIKEGGNALFFIDKVDVQNGGMANPIDTDFSNLLSPYGISIESKLVTDSVHANAGFSQGWFRFSLPYPYWIKAMNVNKENSITSDIESFVLPWASPLVINEKEDVKLQILASTSNKYEILEAPFDISPQEDFIIDTPGEPLPLIVMAEKEGEGKVIITSDSDFAATDFASQFQNNITLFQNMIDALTLGDDLISIRSKGISDRPIISLSEMQKNIIRWGNIMIVPLFFILFGLMRRYVRKGKKKLVI